jgi:hypothetical protein
MPLHVRLPGEDEDLHGLLLAVRLRIQP